MALAVSAQCIVLIVVVFGLYPAVNEATGDWGEAGRALGTATDKIADAPDSALESFELLKEESSE